MTITKYYDIASHRIALTIDDALLRKMRNYTPFEVAEDNSEAVSSALAFELKVNEGPTTIEGFSEEWCQDDEATEIVCGSVGTSPAFLFRWHTVTSGCLICSQDYSRALLTFKGRYAHSAIDNAMMVLFALSTAGKGTLLFHSSTVCHGGIAYMFLGPSGTGKSTHSKLWLENIDDTQLINDDNPALRCNTDGTITVYGTPWSGKTPCYKNVAYPLGAIIHLAQATENRIRRVKGIKAYVILSESVSGKRWEKRVADGLHSTLNLVLKKSSIWHLDCLPDAEAALTCRNAVCCQE